jgi:hypothetical protein
MLLAALVQDTVSAARKRSHMRTAAKVCARAAAAAVQLLLLLSLLLLLPLALLLLLLSVVHERISAAAAALISLVDLQQLHFEVEISVRWNHTACSFAAVAVVASDVQLALLTKGHLQCSTDQRSHLLSNDYRPYMHAATCNKAARTVASRQILLCNS